MKVSKYVCNSVDAFRSYFLTCGFVTDTLQDDPSRHYGSALLVSELSSTALADTRKAVVSTISPPEALTGTCHSRSQCGGQGDREHAIVDSDLGEFCVWVCQYAVKNAFPVCFVRGPVPEPLPCGALCFQITYLL